MELRRQSLTRYIVPLREGGSLTALAEADDGFRYVVKFRGAILNSTFDRLMRDLVL